MKETWELVAEAKSILTSVGFSPERAAFYANIFVKADTIEINTQALKAWGIKKLQSKSVIAPKSFSTKEAPIEVYAWDPTVLGEP